MATKRKIKFFEGNYAESDDDLEIEKNQAKGTKVENEQVEEAQNREKIVIDLTLLESESHRPSEKKLLSRKKPKVAKEEAKGITNKTRASSSLFRDDISVPARTVQSKGTSRPQKNGAAAGPSKRGRKKAPEKPTIILHPDLFRNLKIPFIFYYFPNDVIVQRARIDIAIIRGAKCIRDFRDDVGITHIIVDTELRPTSVMDYKELIRFLKVKALPPGIFVVNEKFIPDCISYGFIANERQGRYWVDGWDWRLQQPMLEVPNEPSTPLSQVPVIRRGPTASPSPIRSRHKCIQYTAKDISPPTLAPQTLELMPKVKSTVLNKARRRFLNPNAHQRDALDEAIAEAKATADLPLDDETDGELNESSEGETADDHKLESNGKSLKLRDSGKTANPSWQAGFACMNKNDGQVLKDNPNAPTIEILQKMASYYDRSKDQWRTNAYRKALSVFRKQSKLVATKEDAQRLPFIGERLAEKIEEIVSTSRLRRLEAANSDPTEKARQVFMGIHGVGLKQANIWIANRLRSLDDLIRSNVTLTKTQKLGLKHYDNFLLRIPRNEVELHQNLVKSVAAEISSDLQVIVGGSFRRGAADSGDIDFLVTAPNLPKHAVASIVFEKLIPLLEEKSYLQCALTDSKEQSQSKWLGAARLPNSGLPVRRVDFLVVPWEELGAALLYWTGNDIFNRSMRLLARKKGIRLNQHGLWRDVLRGPNQEKIIEGTLVEAHDERKIFEALGVPWRPPEHRIC